MSNDKHDTVTVTYNGADEDVRYQPNAAIQALLQQAKHAFALQNSPNNHLLALFTGDGVELDDNQSAADAGVKPGMLLVLRQSTVKGGS
ncbi:EsaB/YukD family protein [Couchioplanes caeruleus]|uniref:EsaB/YukD family protein n=1 Tax=Couchioplanes caeruleus TaxID=56438 RepID=UPI0020BD4AD9|nr:EsaB/YukD family protein [Couchioplanes caeruleus]UQU62527.1 EsaB/YukD family protein [Couchioplanes caeruleus]